MNKHHVQEVREILEHVFTVTTTNEPLGVDGETYPVLEIATMTMDEFSVLHETLWTWVEEKEAILEKANPFQVSGLFIKNKEGRFQHAEVQEALNILAKAKVLKRKFGNRYGMGSRYKMDDTNKVPEIVKYESDWFDFGR